MRITYDFHIHSALSPCADDDMTPENVLGVAYLNGIDAIAISDHNAIENVAAFIRAGEEFGIIVVPAMELQTCEDIHVLCLFENLNDIEKFYAKIPFYDIKNEKEVFGNQLVLDVDGNVLYELERMLLMGCKLSLSESVTLIHECGGYAVAAHIDRETNGVIAVLGDINPDMDFDGVEKMDYGEQEYFDKSGKPLPSIKDSDAHRLQDISKAPKEIEVSERSVTKILNKIFDRK